MPNNALANSTAQYTLGKGEPIANERIADVLRKCDVVRAVNATIQRDWREARLASRRARNAADQARNPERRAEIHRKAGRARSAAYRLARQDVTQAELAEADRLKSAWKLCADWRCHYCQRPAKPKDRTVDHVVPVSRGGKHRPDNLRPACRSCNSRKARESAFYV